MKKLFLMLVLSLFTFVGMAQSEEPILKIGVISDLHNQQSLISGDVESVQLRGTVNTVLNRIKTEEELDVLVLNGDFTSDVTISKENWERVRELIINATRNVFPEGANTPVLYVNGNHEYEVANFDNIPKPYNAGDFYTTPMKTDIGELAASDCFYEEADNGTSGTMSLLAAYHYVIDGFDFVVLNTGKHFFQYAWDYQYSLESVQWVANKLEEIYREDSDKPVFFFAHLPFADSNSISSTSKGLKDCEATRLLKTTLAQYPKLIYIYGHDHGGNNAYIRTETAQRVTQYDRNGNLYTGATTGTTTSVTNLYFKNSATSLYLGRTATSDNIQTFSEKKAATVTPSSTTTGMYNIVLGNEDEENNLYIGSNGRFSGNRETTDLWIYEVTSTENGTTSATKFTGNALENGKSYLFVGEKNSAYYACTNEIYSSGTGARLVGASVTLSGDNLTYVDSNLTDDYTAIWVAEVESSGSTATPSRTISVSSADATMGSAYIGTAGTTSVTQEGGITITALANDGFTFVNWTVNSTEVSTDAEYTDNTEGDKEYVANFVQTPTMVLLEATASCGGGLAHYTSEGGFPVSNVVDGDLDTKFWSSNGQDAGEYILLTLNETKSIGDIKLYFSSGDRPAEANVEISTDNSTWTTVASFTSNDITDNLYVCNANNAEAQYVRLYITKSTSAWLQVVEFEVYESESATPTPSRTISVSSANEAMGSAYIGAAGTTTVTQEGRITITAVANTGFTFVNWTIDGNEVSTDAVYTDNTEGNKAYVANFAQASEKLTATASLGGGMDEPDTRYPLSNAFDNSLGTKYWDNNQVVDSYILLDLSENKAVDEIKIYFDGGDCPGEAVIEYSTDNSTWETATTFTSTNVSDNYYECNAGGVTARYVRMRITTINGTRGLQIKEIEVYGREISTTTTPSRTISVSSADETMGSAYIGIAGVTSATQEGRITITALANDGFTFVNWTVDNTEVSTNAVYTDDTEGDKTYVANFRKQTYADIDKPNNTGSTNNSVLYIRVAEILNSTGYVVDNLPETIAGETDNNVIQAWSNEADPIKVKAGATFDLKVTLGKDGWGDLAIYILKLSGTASASYGPYEASWLSGGDPFDLISSSINNAADAVTAVAEEKSITLPVTIPSDIQTDELLVVRFLFHDGVTTSNPAPTATNMNYCDFVLKAVDTSTITAKAENESLGNAYIGTEDVHSVTVKDGETVTITAKEIYSTEGGFSFHEFLGFYLNGERAVTPDECVKEAENGYNVIYHYTTPAVMADAEYIAHFDTATGINEIDGKVALYYANGKVYTNLAGEIAIYNTTGSLVRRANVAPVAVEDLPAGVYFVKVEGKTLRFVK